MYAQSGPLSRFTPFADNNKLYSKFRTEIVLFLQVLNDFYIESITTNTPPLLIHREAHELLDTYNAGDLLAQREKQEKERLKAENKARK